MRALKTILWVATVGLQVGLAGQVLADEDTWPPLEKAFTGRVRLERGWPRVRPVKEETYPFVLGEGCPKLPIDALKMYRVKVQFEPRRSHGMDIAMGRLPEGLDIIYGPITSVAPDPADGCVLSKGGGALMQFGRYLLVFPTYGKDTYYSYMRSLPLVIKALRDLWGDRAPRKFILVRGGTGEPQLLEIEDYLKTYGDKRDR